MAGAGPLGAVAASSVSTLLGGVAGHVGLLLALGLCGGGTGTAGAAVIGRAVGSGLASLIAASSLWCGGAPGAELGQFSRALIRSSILSSTLSRYLSLLAAAMAWPESPSTVRRAGHLSRQNLFMFGVNVFRDALSPARVFCWCLPFSLYQL